MSLREHMKEMHPRAQLPRSNEDLIKLHQQLHHRYSPNHFHEGVNRGPDERPPGWTTGADAIPNRS